MSPGGARTEGLGFFFHELMQRMIDEVTIVVKAGDGGKGCDSRIRLSDHKFVPNGGEGGRGGDLLMRADSNVTTLRAFTYQRYFAAESGGAGGSNHRRGKRGSDLTLGVPPGTSIFRKDRRLLIRDLIRSGEEVVLVEGGKGGAGSEGGKVAGPGQTGGALEIILSWKIPAEVFLVGLPNTGKSKLLNRLTRAHAKEGTYPFTTKHPELGVYEASDFTSIHLCELPGLYRESLHGRGAGVDFLKHLSRAKMILFFLDPLNAFATTLEEGYEMLLEVLGTYDKSLLEIPRVIVVNKMDFPEAHLKMEKNRLHPSVPLFLVSAETGEGVQALIRYVVQKIGEVRV